MSTVLNRPTLVLNKGWQAIRVESLRDALTKCFMGVANFIDHEDYSVYSWEQWCDRFAIDFDGIWDETHDDGNVYVKTPELAVRAPDVIVLTTYNRIPSVQVKLTRRNLFLRDKFMCQYTGEKLTMKTGTIDHVIPRTQGGKTTWDNVVLASLDANVKKGGRTPEEAGMKLRKKPKRPAWHPMYTYAMSRHPESWDKFIKTDQWNAEGYWDVELQD